MLLFSIRPSSAHCFTLHHHVQSNKSDISSHHFLDTLESAYLQKNAEITRFPIHWTTQIVQRHEGTLDKSLRTLGGVKLFLFLYALVF